MSFFSISQNANMFSSDYFQQRMEKMVSRTAEPNMRLSNTSILPKRVFSPLKINPTLFNQKKFVKNEEKENITRVNKFSDFQNSQTQTLRQNFSSCSGFSYNTPNQRSFYTPHSVDHSTFEKQVNKNELFDEIKKNLRQYLAQEFNTFKKKIDSLEIINQTDYEHIIRNIESGLHLKLNPYNEDFKHCAKEVEQEIKTISDLFKKNTKLINEKFTKFQNIWNLYLTLTRKQKELHDTNLNYLEKNLECLSKKFMNHSEWKQKSITKKKRKK